MVVEQEEAWGLEEGEGSQAKPCSEQMVVLGGLTRPKVQGGFWRGDRSRGMEPRGCSESDEVEMSYSSYIISCYLSTECSTFIIFLSYNLDYRLQCLNI